VAIVALTSPAGSTGPGSENRRRPLTPRPRPGDHLHANVNDQIGRHRFLPRSSGQAVALTVAEKTHPQLVIREFVNEVGSILKDDAA
jgi:hypothetical protein